jgi:uncharacterized protein (DUF4213/DUF364 family)
MIVDDLRSHLVSTFPEQHLVDVRIGLGYTAVMLTDGNVGVAYTFREDAAAGCSVFMGMRPLAGATTTQALKYLGSGNGVESTLGLAVANALANRPGPCQHEGDVLEFLEIQPGDRVGMVGYFGPLVIPLEKKGCDLTIFEREASRSDRVLPAEEALDRLPTSDIAIITSTTLILGDLDRLLDAALPCRKVALVGASTPLVPNVFRENGVDLLSGITVTDAAGILQIVSEGGGMGFFGSRIRKVNVWT